MKVYGVTGWKNSGKTTLVERLVAEITARGLTVSTVKHAHHSFDIDRPGKDSHRHRLAGATQVLVSSRQRWALMTENRTGPEPPLAELLARLDPVDLVLIEGYKRDRHPKIEARRLATAQSLIAAEDPTIEAIATDAPLGALTDHARWNAPAADIPAGAHTAGAAPAGAATLPNFDLDDIPAIADFILDRTGLPRTLPREGAG
jgi:molybdopterin-guanine dinucleotide biosynthesis adapter protein